MHRHPYACALAVLLAVALWPVAYRTQPEDGGPDYTEMHGYLASADRMYQSCETVLGNLPAYFLVFTAAGFDTRSTCKRPTS